jgi:hypothetical protein
MTPRAWWVPLALAPVLVIFTVCALNALAWLDRPFPGFLVLENGLLVSIGRTEWANVRYRNLPFARVLAVDGQPVSSGREVRAYVAAVGAGRSVTYTFRQGTNIFRLALRVRPFTRGDFLELFAPFLGVGLLMVLVSTAVVILRPNAPHARALFVVCLAVGLILITSPDMYSPYWFAPVAFLATCLLAPASVHLALTFPQPRTRVLRRPVLYALLYLPFVGLAAALWSSMPEPSLFLPLLYTVYFLIANGTLLNVGALAFALVNGAQPRQPIVLGLAAVLGSSLIAASILATYPLLPQPISPGWAFGPLLLLPILDGVAFVRFPVPALPAS